MAALAIAVNGGCSPRNADATRHLKAELELRAREEQLARLLESAMDAILVLDARFDIVSNPVPIKIVIEKHYSFRSIPTRTSD